MEFLNAFIFSRQEVLRDIKVYLKHIVKFLNRKLDITPDESLFLSYGYLSLLPFLRLIAPDSPFLSYVTSYGPSTRSSPRYSSNVSQPHLSAIFTWVLCSDSLFLACFKISRASSILPIFSLLAL